MKFDFIKEALASGISAEDLVAQFTEALNEAEKNQKEVEKKAELCALIADFCSWMREYVDQDWAKVELNEVEIEAVADSIIEMFAFEVPVVKNKETAAAKDEDIFKAFFALNKLLS